MFRALDLIDPMGWLLVLALTGWFVLLFWVLGKLSLQDWVGIIVTIIIMEFAFLR